VPADDRAAYVQAIQAGGKDLPRLIDEVLGQDLDLLE
jgi:hypothetical protein